MKITKEQFDTLTEIQKKAETLCTQFNADRSLALWHFELILKGLAAEIAVCLKDYETVETLSCMIDEHFGDYRRDPEKFDYLLNTNNSRSIIHYFEVYDEIEIIG